MPASTLAGLALLRSGECQRPRLILLAALAGLLCPVAASSAEIPLYPTGPSQDAAFVRFVNAQAGGLEFSAAGANTRTKLSPEQPSSPFYTVDANTRVKGRFHAGGQPASDIGLTVKPGEFATVVALPGAGAVKQAILREQPDDFNALKVSLALYNIDPQCGNAGLNVVGRSAALFEAVAAGSLQRRALNPVSISVQLLCNGKVMPTTLALGALQAGQRYSVFVVPAASPTGATQRLFITSDSVAR
jgi:hypothetical protein